MEAQLRSLKSTRTNTSENHLLIRALKSRNERDRTRAKLATSPTSPFLGTEESGFHMIVEKPKPTQIQN